MKNIEERNFDPFGDVALLGDFEFSKSSELEAHVRAKVIAGFDLSSYSMNIENSTRTLTIRLPEPSIISSSINIEFKEPKSETFSPKIDSATYNKINIKAKEKALKNANKEKIFDEAKKSAYTSVMNIFQPLMSLPQFNYKVEVYFDQNIYPSGDTKIENTQKISTSYLFQANSVG